MAGTKKGKTTYFFFWIFSLIFFVDVVSGTWDGQKPGINIPDPSATLESVKNFRWRITFEIKSHTTDLRELWSCAGQLAIRGSPAAAVDSPAVFTGISSDEPSLSGGGAPWFSSGAPSLAASAGSWGGLSGGVSSDARNSFRFTCGSASPDDQFRKIDWMNERTF